MEVAAEHQFNPQGALYLLSETGHAKARPLTAPADSGNESERSWPSSEGSASSTASSGAPFERDEDIDLTELWQQPHHNKRCSKGPTQPAPLPMPQRSCSSQAPPGRPARGAAAIHHPATTTSVNNGTHCSADTAPQANPTQGQQPPRTTTLTEPQNSPPRKRRGRASACHQPRASLRPPPSSSQQRHPRNHTTYH